MTEEEFNLYLQNTVAEYVRNPMLMLPDVFCSLLVLLDYVEADEKKHLKEMENNGEDIHEHIYFDIEALAQMGEEAAKAEGKQLGRRAGSRGKKVIRLEAKGAWTACSRRK